MPRINLLPWREELRKQRQKNFAIAVVGALLGAALVTFLAGMIVQGRIDYQGARNARLEQEIARLDKLIEEIANLERQKERLLARMEVIEELQRRRPDSVHLFDQLIRIVPDGVYYQDVRQSANRIQLDGMAESSTRVSSLMRNVEASQWLQAPGLEVVESEEDPDGIRRSRFRVSALQVTEDPNTGEVAP